MDATLPGLFGVCAGTLTSRRQIRDRVAQYIIRNTKQIQKQNSIKPNTRTPGKCIIVLVFPPRRFTGIGGNIQRYVTMASSAVDRRRNRLGHGKSNMLVGLFHNLRLLKRMRKLLYTEQCVGWNDEDEKTGSFALVLSSL